MLYIASFIFEQISMSVKQTHAMEPTHTASILMEAFTVTAILDTQEMGSSAQVHGL